jgi:chaperone required for assembly of F1-ATPase
MIDFNAAEKYVSENRDFIETTLAEFVLTDTVLFWSDKAEIKSLQKEQWQPVLDCLAEQNNWHFCTTEDFCLPQENEHNGELFAGYLKTLSLKKITALYLAATNMKSPLLAVAMIENILPAIKAFDLAFLEELYQVKEWGEDVSAANLRQKILEDLQTIEEYLNGKMCAC